MGTLQFSSLARLTDRELLAKVTRLAAEERQSTALLIAHLAELDARGLYLAEGYSSLFNYCTQALHLSEYAAYSRIQAARASRKFPVLLGLLSEGALNLTTVGPLAPHLTVENHEDLLEEARFKSKPAVEELIARLFPRPAVPSVLRRLPLSRLNSSPPSPSDEESPGGNPDHQEMVVEAQSPLPALALHRKVAVIECLAPERCKVQFTASKETYEKLRQVRNLLRHQIPDGDLDQVIQRALTALLHDLAAKKVAATQRPRAASSADRSSRHIPAEIRRAVWLRDGGRCGFVGKKGRRCDEVGFLEFHHVEPYAAGGQASLENIQLRCRAHNAYEAEQHFGPRDSAAVSETPGSYSVRIELTHIEQGGDAVQRRRGEDPAPARQFL